MSQSVGYLNKIIYVFPKCHLQRVVERLFTHLKMSDTLYCLLIISFIKYKKLKLFIYCFYHEKVLFTIVCDETER